MNKLLSGADGLVARAPAGSIQSKAYNFLLSKVEVSNMGDSRDSSAWKGVALWLLVACACVPAVMRGVWCGLLHHQQQKLLIKGLSS
jgi:hypothetical protein